MGEWNDCKDDGECVCKAKGCVGPRHEFIKDQQCCYHTKELCCSYGNDNNKGGLQCFSVPGFQKFRANDDDSTKQKRQKRCEAAAAQNGINAEWFNQKHPSGAQGSQFHVNPVSMETCIPNPTRKAIGIHYGRC